MIVAPSTTFTAILEGAATGLVGTAGVQIIDGQTNAVVVARISSGIAESPVNSGVYEVQLTSPSMLGEYLIVWDDGGSSPSDYATESLTVAGIAPATTILVRPGATSLRLPQANAVVSQCLTRSAVEDWDRADAGTIVWSGKADAYLTRSSVRVGDQATDTNSVVTNRTILLPRGLPAAVGMSIVLTTNEGDQETVIIRTIDRRIPPLGMDGPIKVTGEAT